MDNKEKGGGGKYAVAKIFAKESDAQEEIDMLKVQIDHHSNLVTMLQD